MILFEGMAIDGGVMTQRSSQYQYEENVKNILGDMEANVDYHTPKGEGALNTGLTNGSQFSDASRLQGFR